jgi:hypothetical protein
MPISEEDYDVDGLLEDLSKWYDIQGSFSESDKILLIANSERAITSKHPLYDNCPLCDLSIEDCVFLFEWMIVEALIPEEKHWFAYYSCPRCDTNIWTEH